MNQVTELAEGIAGAAAIYRRISANIEKVMQGQAAAIHQIYSIMQTGQAKFGMQTLNQSLYELYVKKQISYEDCIGRSSVVDELIQMLGRSGLAATQVAPNEYR